MASAATPLRFLRELRCFSKENSLPVGHSSRSRNNLVLPRHPINYSSVLTSAHRRGSASNSPPLSSKKLKKRQISHDKGAQEEDDFDEDPFEALFQQLEEDLKNDSLSMDDSDDDINEDDIAKLEQELEEALKDDELIGALDTKAVMKEDYESENGEDKEGDDVHQNSFDDDEEEGDDEQSMANLKTWQLKRLAYALKNGRRKTSIKNLAADLCLDRALVLRLLRDPPPNLLMLSAALPDNTVSRIVEPMHESTETASLETATSNSRAEVKVKLPVHVMQRNWSAKKRLKKSQCETLELVYRRTKRPTNSMISSIVQVTHLPRKRVVKWFEDKREEEGVTDRRIPYQRAAEAQL